MNHFKSKLGLNRIRVRFKVGSGLPPPGSATLLNANLNVKISAKIRLRKYRISFKGMVHQTRDYLIRWFVSLHCVRVK